MRSVLSGFQEEGVTQATIIGEHMGVPFSVRWGVGSFAVYHDLLPRVHVRRNDRDHALLGGSLPVAQACNALIAPSGDV